MALWMTFLLGRQAMFGQEPPTYFRSTTAVFIPFLASVHERSLPAAPLPRMSRSYSSASLVRAGLPAVCRFSKSCVVFIFARWLVSAQLLCRPAAIHAQDGSSDERIFQQRDNRLCRFLDGAEASYRMQPGQPIALTVVCFRFPDHAVHHRRLDRAKCNRIH